jgi:hypothetical protein
MAVLMFQKRFAPLVKSGAKRQTIRPKRKHPIKPGDHLSLREWEGVAYRSKQVELGEARCKSAVPITVTNHFAMVRLAGESYYWTGNKDADRFAQADGFDSLAEMIQWFDETHGLPFHGELIRW